MSKYENKMRKVADWILESEMTFAKSLLSDIQDRNVYTKIENFLRGKSDSIYDGYVEKLKEKYQ